MNRIAMCLLLSAFVGCSPETIPSGLKSGTGTEIDDGGVFENADREKAEEFFVALGNVKTVEDEQKLMTEFGKWLRRKGYKIKVEVNMEKHVLSCPCFPPETPWTGHSFLDVKNLELLPKLDDDL